MKRLLLLLILLVSGLRADLRSDYITDIVSSSEVYDVMGTGSMEPSFNQDWWLVVDKTPWQKVKVGDVILYRAPQGMRAGNIEVEIICHRVVRVSSGHSIVLCRGDANSFTDSTLVTEERYLGTVVGTFRRPR